MRVAGPITPSSGRRRSYELVDFVSREPILEETFLAEYGQTRTAPRRRLPGDGARPPSTAAGIRPSALGRAGSTAWAASSPRRSATRAARSSSSAVLIGADPRRRHGAIATAVQHARVARTSWSTWSTAVPPILAGPGRHQSVNVEHAGRIRPVQVRHVLPDRAEPVVRARAVRHARRRGAARQPRVRRRDAGLARRRIAAREAGGTPRPAWPSSVVVTFLSDRLAGRRVRDACRATRSPVAPALGYALWLVLVALAVRGGRVRARAVHRPRGGGGHRRRDHSSPASSSTATRRPSRRSRRSPT